MKTLLILIPLFYAIWVQAEPLERIRQPDCNFSFYSENSRIFLQSARCDLLAPELRAFRSWKQLANEPPGYIQKLKRTSSGCSADITDILPNQVVKYNNAFCKIGGPNCFNLALSIAGIDLGPRFTSGNEMEAAINSGLCQKIDNPSDLKPGTLGLIWDYDFTTGNAVPLHSFIHISKNLVFSKNSISMSDPPLLQCRTNMYFSYDPESISLNCKKPNQIDSCKRRLEYFQCQSLDSYIKKNEGAFSKEQLSLVYDIQKFEAIISDKVRNSKSLSSDTNQKMEKELNRLTHDINQEKAKIQAAPVNAETQVQLNLLGFLGAKLGSFEVQKNNYTDKDVLTIIRQLFN